MVCHVGLVFFPKDFYLRARDRQTREQSQGSKGTACIIIFLNLKDIFQIYLRSVFICSSFGFDWCTREVTILLVDVCCLCIFLFCLPTACIGNLMHFLRHLGQFLSLFPGLIILSYAGSGLHLERCPGHINFQFS